MGAVSKSCNKNKFIYDAPTAELIDMEAADIIAISDGGGNLGEWDPQYTIF